MRRSETPGKSLSYNEEKSRSRPWGSFLEDLSVRNRGGVGNSGEARLAHYPGRGIGPPDQYNLIEVVPGREKKEG